MYRPITLLVSQAAQPTGMARVTRAMAGRLAQHREVHVLGIDFFSPGKRQTIACSDGYILHSNPNDWDYYGELALAELCQELQPASVLLYHDPWCIPRLQRAIPNNIHTCVVAYCPIDGKLMHSQIVTELLKLDGLAVPTLFAANVLTSTELGSTRPAEQFLEPASKPVFSNLTVIPHGVDLADFGPYGGNLPDFQQRRRVARQALFPDQAEYWSGFWVANVNRNHSRKKLDLTLRGFARFAANKPPDVRLYLHWGSERTGAKLFQLARNLGISDRVIMATALAGVSTNQLNLIYNATNVGVNTAIGEGWGLASFEHASTGAAQIVPAHSACLELWAGAAELLPVRRTLSLAGVTEGGEVGPDDLAETLERLYNDEHYCNSLAIKGYERTHQPQFRWDAIGIQWHQWLSEVEASCFSVHSVNQ